MNSVMFENNRMEPSKIEPSKVVCVGRNYAKHVAELNNEITGDMVIFMKPNSSVSAELKSYHQEPLHYEGEISFLIENGKFAGVGFGLDLTKRTLQSDLKQKKLPWERAKSFTGAAVFDRFVALPEAADISALSLELWIDDVLTQKGSVSDMLFKPDVVLEDLKTFITLEDGDIVMTGTPEGVGEVKFGSCYRGCIFLGEQLLVESSWIAA